MWQKSVKEIGKVSTNRMGQPHTDVMITSCGEMNLDKPFAVKGSPAVDRDL